VELPAPIRGLVDESIVNLEASAMTLVRNLLEGTLVLLANLPALLLAPVIAYYVLRDFDVLKSRTYDMMPNGRTGALAQLLRDIDAALNGFIRGQFILGVVVGALVAVFTTLVGLKFGLLLGILAAFGEFIPYFGPFLAAIPAVGFALIRSPVLAAKVALGYVLIQQVESLFLAPKVIGTNVGIHPVAVVFVLLVGATLFGFLGLLLSVPLVVVGRLLLRFVLDNYAPRIS
jgi:predicted PurR-regulated permease PerM